MGWAESFHIRSDKATCIHPATLLRLLVNQTRLAKGGNVHKDRTKNDEKLGSAPVGIVEERALYLQRHLFHGWGDPHHHAKESVLRDGALRLMRQDCGACGLR